MRIFLKKPAPIKTYQVHIHHTAHLILSPPSLSFALSPPRSHNPAATAAPAPAHAWHPPPLRPLSIASRRLRERWPQSRAGRVGEVDEF